MALTFGNNSNIKDDRWKRMNYRIVSLTREEAVRPKLFALEIINLYIKKLKEVYSEVLSETAPFLMELFEDPN